MKRWFIARMVQQEGETVPKVATYPNVNFRIWTKDEIAFCMGQLATNNLNQFVGDPDVRLIPDTALDNLISSLSPAVRTAMQDALTTAGFSLQGVNNTWSIRQLLKHLKLQLQPDDVIDDADVKDIEN